VEWVDSGQNGVVAFCSNRLLQLERRTVQALLTCLSQSIQRSRSQDSLNPRKICRTLSLSRGATLNTRRPDLEGLTPTSPPDKSSISGSPLTAPSDRKQQCPMLHLYRRSFLLHSHICKYLKILYRPCNSYHCIIHVFVFIMQSKFMFILRSNTKIDSCYLSYCFAVFKMCSWKCVSGLYRAKHIVSKKEYKK
jgi:hypothetical protein